MEKCLLPPEAEVGDVSGEELDIVTPEERSDSWAH